jgi:Protein of unknown function (DUF1559)/Domain of unknown function (DUF4190)
MAIVVECDCGQKFQARDEDAGRLARCPACQREVVIPKPGGLADTEFAAFDEVGPVQTSGKAIASLVLGLLSFVTCFITGIPALIFGILGLNDINNPKNRLSGKGMAVTGMVLGSVTSVLMLPFMLIALLLPAVQSAREAARRAQCANNLKQIGLAMHNFNSAKGTFPPAASYDAGGKPLLSWRVLILPYLEQPSLYSQFHLDEPWDSPHNKPLSDQIPNVYRCPSENLPPGLTTYQVIVGPSAMFTGTPSGVSVSDITDGTSNTLMAVESASPVPWTKPEDLSLTSTNPSLGMGSKHPGGWNVMMGDGSVRFLKNSISLQLLKALATRDGGEVIAASDY